MAYNNVRTKITTKVINYNLKRKNMDKNFEKTAAWVNKTVAHAIETEKSKKPKVFKNI